MVAELDPTDWGAVVEVLAEYRYKYSNEKVDAEGTFIHKGTPHIFFKEVNHRAMLCRFTKLNPEEIHTLEKVGELASKAYRITGASLNKRRDDAGGCNLRPSLDLPQRSTHQPRRRPKRGRHFTLKQNEMQFCWSESGRSGRLVDQRNRATPEQLEGWRQPGRRHRSLPPRSWVESGPVQNRPEPRELSALPPIQRSGRIPALHYRTSHTDVVIKENRCGQRPDEQRGKLPF